MNAPINPDRLPADGAAPLRVPPHSIEAEQSVLGGLLLDNLAWDRAADLLTDSDFYRYENRQIYAVIGSLVAAGKPADVVTVNEALQGLGKADECGGLVYLNALAQCVPSIANVRRYAEIVRERAVLRKLVALGSEIVDSAFDPQGRTAAQVLDAAASAIGELDRRQQRKVPRHIRDLVGQALERVDDLDKRRDATYALPTGLPDLDRLLNGGLRPGKVFCIAARPGIGKSSAARTILLHAAHSGAPTLLLSQEMLSDEVTDGLLAESCRINGSKLQTGKLDDEDWSRLPDGASRLASIPDLYIDDDGGLTLAQIRTKARSVKGLRVLAIDYLQLCTSTLRNKSTNDEIGELSKGIKALALEMQISVVLLSQLNREVEKRPGKEPQLSDLRDSGNIEQDIDVAMLLWSPNEHEVESRLVGWKIPKHRGGPKGVFAMRWRPAINEWRPSDEPLRPAGTPGRDRGSEL